MILTWEMIEERMREHRAWQDREAERLADELWNEIVGKRLGTAKPVDRYPKEYKGLPDVTVNILNGLGR
jgi:uncharacterized protein YhfF